MEILQELFGEGFVWLCSVLTPQKNLSRRVQKVLKIIFELFAAALYILCLIGIEIVAVHNKTFGLWFILPAAIYSLTLSRKKQKAVL